ncbi:hypothetical protein PMAYCL1PPCAC_07583, partial [Pristionchus mayeri]
MISKGWKTVTELVGEKKIDRMCKALLKSARRESSPSESRSLSSLIGLIADGKYYEDGRVWKELLECIVVCAASTSSHRHFFM